MCKAKKVVTQNMNSWKRSLRSFSRQSRPGVALCSPSPLMHWHCLLNQQQFEVLVLVSALRV